MGILSPSTLFFNLNIKGIMIRKIKKTDIKSYIDALEGSYSHEEVKEGLKKLKKRQESERKNWSSSIGGVDSIEKMFELRK